ncbi:MAG: hypothetical protein WAW37_05655 [Syntrophobacteraceae bacterium]
MLGLTFGINRSVGMVEESKDIHRAITDVLELLKPLLRFLGAQIRGKPHEDLDSG